MHEQKFLFFLRNVINLRGVQCENVTHDLFAHVHLQYNAKLNIGTDKYFIHIGETYTNQLLRASYTSRQNEYRHKSAI